VVADVVVEATGPAAVTGLLVAVVVVDPKEAGTLNNLTSMSLTRLRSLRSHERDSRPCTDRKRRCNQNQNLGSPGYDILMHLFLCLLIYFHMFSQCVLVHISDDAISFLPSSSYHVCHPLVMNEKYEYLRASHVLT